MQSCTRRGFCLSLSAAGALKSWAASADPVILLTPAQSNELRPNDAVRETVAAALKSGPWSVTAHRPPNVDATPHDYYSEGPYWWPDPKDPKAPYIRKDGERNPDRFMGNRTDLGNMCSAVLALGMGGFLLNDKPCGAHATEVLSTWFLDPKTRMDPNLEYGQAVRGHNTGRGTGLIDTASMIHVVQGVWLLERAGMLEPSIGKGMRDWFTAFTRWMTSSAKGLDEKNSGNNHSTWWTAQVAAYAGFTADDATLKMAWDHYRKVLVPTEIDPDGSCPRELARTNSLSYSAMNLDAFSLLCRIASIHGVDLWTFRDPKGVGVEKSFHYLAPYVAHPSTWKGQQISKFNNDGTFFAGLAGIGLHDAGLLDVYRSLPRGRSPWTQFLDLVVKTA